MDYNAFRCQEAGLRKKTKGPVLPPGLSLFLSAECWT
jgi:hypothetical protein